MDIHHGAIFPLMFSFTLDVLDEKIEKDEKDEKDRETKGLLCAKYLREK